MNLKNKAVQRFLVLALQTQYWRANIEPTSGQRLVFAED